LIKSRLKNLSTLLLGNLLPVSYLVLVLGNSIDEVSIVFISKSVLENVGQSQRILQDKQGQGECNDDQNVGQVPSDFGVDIIFVYILV